MDVGDVTLSGQRGDTVAVFIDGDATLLNSLSNAEALTIRVGDSEIVRPLRLLKGGALVYRFVRSEQVAVHYSVARHAPAAAKGNIKLTQVTNASVVSANTPWAGKQAAPLFDDVDPRLCVNGYSISADGSGCGLSWTFSQVAPAEAFTIYGAQFQSDAGTGQSHDIVVTFSRPVSGIAVGIYDPTYVGNFVAVYDSLGNEVGRKDFAAYGEGNYGVDDTEIHGSISKVLLHPAEGDFVDYGLYIIVPAGCRVPTPVYKQSAPAPWHNDLYDHDGTQTIGYKGCGLTSLTMAIAANGGPSGDGFVDPGEVNRLLKAAPGDQFIDGGMNWPVNTASLTGGFLKYRQVRDTAQMRRELCAGNAVIVGVKLVGNTAHHFVLVTGIESDGSFTINDPATGTTRPLTAYPKYSFRGAIAPSAVPAPTQTRVASGGTGSLSTDLVLGAVESTLGLSAPNAAVVATDATGRHSSFNPATGDTVTDIPGSYAFGDMLDNDETGEVATNVTTTVAIEVVQPGTYRFEITPSQTHGDSAFLYNVVSSSSAIPSFATLPYDGIAGNTISYDATVSNTGLTVVPTVKDHVLTKYLCGNVFGVRNKNGVAIDVSYVVTTGETGILHLPPRPANSPYSQVTFSTVTKGDISIYAYGALIATRSNEGKTCH